jgi:hypothetical protein
VPARGFGALWQADDCASEGDPYFANADAVPRRIPPMGEDRIVVFALVRRSEALSTRGRPSQGRAMWHR